MVIILMVKPLIFTDTRHVTYMFERFKQSILDVAQFSQAELNIITSKLHFLQLKKGEFILKEGRICQGFCFVQHGSFRQYYITDNGEDVTTNLLTDGDWVMNYESFTAQKPSRSYIQAIENSEVLELSVYALHDLIGTSPSFFRIGRILERAFEPMQFQSTRLSPEERYHLLVSNKPQIIRRFPLKYVASFLSMTPETLSRARRKLMTA